MRIIAGRWGGRRLTAPKGQTTRPTSDRAKESLFSALFDVTDARVLDLYAGTGALGLEALSRGARHATFVERGRPALAALQANIDALKATEVTVMKFDVRRALNALSKLSPRFDVIFADPPYALDAAVQAEAFEVAQSLLADDGTLVWEHQHAAKPPGEPKRSLRQGEAAFALYSRYIPSV